MIIDLLDVTEANILIISEGKLVNIVEILKSNNYLGLQYANNIQTTIDSFQTRTPDLIIFAPQSKLGVVELADKLSTLESFNGLPPIFLLNDKENHIPLIDTAVKDFINLPINENEFLYRVYHLLKDHFTKKELYQYNQNILDAVDQRNKELKESQIEIIECLGYAAEFRDSETGMHTIRVGLYAQCLAKAMGMNDKEAESLLYSAPMHDIGKIGIPDMILLKPARLEDQEWEVMKQHTIIGEKILSRSRNKLLKQAGVIALNHHEKWDGSGYPKGLSGTDIHLFGRLVAIVDVFDALTMKRPYKKAWTIASAVDLINRESGKHFDPSLVELFNCNLDQIVEIKDTHADEDSNTYLLDEYLSH